MILEQDNFALGIEAFDVTGAPQALSATLAAACPTAPPSFALLSAEGSPDQGGLAALVASDGALVAAEITRAGSSVTMACHTRHELPNPATLATRSPSGRLVAAAAANQLYLVDPSNPRVRASVDVDPNMDSLTYAPELPGLGAAIYTSTLSPILLITYAR